MIDHNPVVLTLSNEEAENFSDALSDILCWTRGFFAGLGENISNAPIGVEELRVLNIKLKAAINRTKESKQ